MAALDSTPDLTHHAERGHALEPGVDYQIHEGSRLESAEVREGNLESAEYTAHGYKAQELREFRSLYEGEFTDVESRTCPVERFGDPEGVVKNINPYFEDESRSYQVNCADCARSVERTWRGNHEEAAGRTPQIDASGAVKPHGERSPITEEWAGEKFSPTPDDARLRQALTNGGHGSSAIVHSSWKRDGRQAAGGHAYNLVNYHGEIRVLDGQISKSLDWETGNIHPMIGRSPLHVAMAWNARGERIW